MSYPVRHSRLLKQVQPYEVFTPDAGFWVAELCCVSDQQKLDMILHLVRFCMVWNNKYDSTREMHFYRFGFGDGKMRYWERGRELQFLFTPTRTG